MENKIKQFARIRGVHAEYIPEAGSTNDLARNAIYGHGDVIIVHTQNCGRGQRGNVWESAPGANLTFSVVVEPHFLPAGEQFLLSEAVSLAVADTLSAYNLIPQIKWPNDIYVGNNKIAGILIENDICGANLSRSIIGIGLNVNQNLFPVSIPNPTSMNIEAGALFCLYEVFERLYDNLMLRYIELTMGYADSLQKDYHNRLYRYETAAEYRLANGRSFTGIILGVRSSGELIMQHDNSDIQSYVFKEIEFVL